MKPYYQRVSWGVLTRWGILLTIISSLLSVVPATARAQAIRRLRVDTTPAASPPAVSGVPSRSEAVTVVPFVAIDDSDKIVLPVEVNGRRGIMVLDLSCPSLQLNRTFLQRTPTGGVDTVTASNQLPDSVREEEPRTWEKVHVALRIGTLPVPFDDRFLDRAPGTRVRPGPYNAVLTHEFDNFGAEMEFSGNEPSPRLGNIGLAVLEPFETILDYVHRRVVLIRLDATGHRLAPVPAYTPRWSAPLLAVRDSAGNRPWWGVRAIGHAVSADFIFTMRENSTAPWGPVERDSLTIAGRVFPIPAGFEGSDDAPHLGASFLEQVGMIGFNPRTHQIILYQ